MTTEEGVRERLLAYILPRAPETDDQEEAMDRAVEAQVAYDAITGLSDIPANVSAISNDGVSMTFNQRSEVRSYTRDNISPVAWSILRNAGLIAYVWPTARRM